MPFGGRYEEDAYYAIGSGGKDARTTLKKTVHTPEITRQDALEIVAEALWDAADEEYRKQAVLISSGKFSQRFTLLLKKASLRIPETTVEELYRELISRF